MARDESDFGVTSPGVPIVGRDGRVIAASAIVFSSYFDNDDYRERQLALLAKARSAIEEKLRG